MLYLLPSGEIKIYINNSDLIVSISTGNLHTNGKRNFTPPHSNIMSLYVYLYDDNYNANDMMCVYDIDTNKISHSSFVS